MQCHSAFVFTLVLLALTHVCVLSHSVEVSDNEINNFGFLGSVDGKSFFYELYPGRTWREAKEACNISNMALASITSSRQVQFLNDATGAGLSNYTNNWFWTAGHLQFSVETISQFRWDTDNSTVSDHGAGLLEGQLVEQCLLYAAYTAGGKLYSWGCTGSWGVLCEAYHSI